MYPLYRSTLAIALSAALHVGVVYVGADWLSREPAQEEPERITVKLALFEPPPEPLQVRPEPLPTQPAVRRESAPRPAPVPLRAPEPPPPPPPPPAVRQEPPPPPQPPVEAAARREPPPVPVSELEPPVPPAEASPPAPQAEPEPVAARHMPEPEAPVMPPEAPVNEAQATEVAGSDDTVPNAPQRGTGVPAAPEDDVAYPESRADYAAVVSSVRNGIDAAKRYPRLARQAGFEGRTLLKFKLLPSGEVTELRVLESSGHALLDDAAEGAVRRAAPFPEEGQKVKGQWIEVILPVVFQLR